MSRYLRSALLLAAKDLRAEARARDILPQMLAFTLVLIVVLHFLFESAAGGAEPQAAGTLLVAFSFSGMLGIARSFAGEREYEAVKGLLLLPVGRSAIYVGKVLSNFIFDSVLALASVIEVGIFFNLDIARVFLGLIGVIELAAFGFAAVGTLYAAMTSNVRFREVLLPLLMFPIVVPLLLAASRLVAASLADHPPVELSNWMNLMIAYDGIFFVIGLLTFEFVISE